MWREEPAAVGGTLPRLDCDIAGCKQSLLGAKKHDVIQRARVGGWGIYEGTTIGGKELISHVCPTHRGQRGRK